MTQNHSMKISPQRRVSAWLVHLLTASAAILGLLTLYAIYQANYLTAFWFMLATIFIDSIDGTLARFAKVREAAPQVDGALLDNIVDYFNYVITPAFFLLVSGILPLYWNVLAASAVVLSSAYQFSQADAKTADHFFKGFPSYWNFVVFYLFLCNFTPWVNFSIIITFVILIFIPIKYLYLSRIDYVFTSLKARIALMVAVICYGIATLGLLVSYPAMHPLFVYYSWFFGVLYAGLSLYRTFKPLPLRSR
jgi:phosphatidylcholine synthase